MIKVVRPSYFNMGKLFGIITGLYVIGEVESKYTRREYMRRVRERNLKRMLNNENPKPFGRLQLMTLDGKELTLASVKAKFPVLFFGEFKTFVNLLSVFSDSPYSKELHFVFVSDEKTIQKIKSGTMRTEIPNT